MIKTVPKTLVNLPEEMEAEFEQNKLPYPADVKNCMLTLWKELEKNSSVGKRAKRKISKTFKKIFKKDASKNSLSEKNKISIKSFVCLYSFFNKYCKDNEIDTANEKIGSIRDMLYPKFDVVKESSTSKETNECLYNIISFNEPKANQLSKSDYKSVILSFCKEIYSILSDKVNLTGSCINNGKRSIITRDKEVPISGLDFERLLNALQSNAQAKNLPTEYYRTKEKLGKCEDLYIKNKEMIAAVEKFFTSTDVKEVCPNKEFSDAMTSITNCKTNLKGLSYSLKQYRGVISYGQTFIREGKKCKGTHNFITPLIEAANSYNKWCGKLKSCIESYKVTSAEIRRHLDTLKTKTNVLKDTCKNFFESYDKNIKQLNATDYGKDISYINNNLVKVEKKLFENNYNIENLDSLMNVVKNAVNSKDSWKSKLIEISQMLSKISTIIGYAVKVAAFIA